MTQRARTRPDPIAALREPSYLLFLVGSMLSNTGNQMRAAAVGWEVYHRTHEPINLGYVGLVLALPVILLAMPAGAAADRYSRRAIIMIAQAGLAVSGVGLAWASYTHAPLGWVYFFLLGTGLTAILEAGILSENVDNPFLMLGGLMMLLLWPPLHIILLYRGIHPVSAILRKVMNNKPVRFISASERLAGTFCRRHPVLLVSAILVSILAAAGMVLEFFCITWFLQIDLNVWQTIAAWTAGWLAFLVPVPGGLGALEASEVFALGAFGIPAASAISVTLLIRARDLFIGALGIIIAGRGVSR